MKELQLKYGCNPNQCPAKVFVTEGELPFRVLNGAPGYINLLDAMNGWQLVRELKEATGFPAATSFKHVSPAGAAIAKPLDDLSRELYFVDDMELSPIATAYIRARGADRMSSYGDFIALSDCCDVTLAKYLVKEVSDGIIAPGYSEEALQLLKNKKRGTYVILQMDETYEPEPMERKQVFGITFEQARNAIKLTKDRFSNIVTENKSLPEEALCDLQVAMITLKYTQSNSVCYVKDGQAIGIGAGQQSRVHCTRLAGNKADNWYLRQHEKVRNLPFLEGLRKPEKDNAIDSYITEGYEELVSGDNWKRLFTEKPVEFTKEEKKAWLTSMTGIALGSDAFFPFGDSIERAAKSGVQYVVEPGGSKNDPQVIEEANHYGMTMVMTTGVRLFHH